MTAEYEGRLFVGGEFREAQSGHRFEVINPADESVVGTAADATAEALTIGESSGPRSCADRILERYFNA